MKAWTLLRKFDTNISAHQTSTIYISPNLVVNRIIELPRNPRDKIISKQVRSNLYTPKEGAKTRNEFAKDFDSIEVQHAIDDLENEESASIDGMFPETYFFLKNVKN